MDNYVLPDEQNKALESSLKRHTALIKRIRQSIGLDNREQILKDIESLTLEKYIEEIAGAVPEGIVRCKLEKDVWSATEVRYLGGHKGTHVLDTHIFLPRSSRPFIGAFQPILRHPSLLRSLPRLRRRTKQLSLPWRPSSGKRKRQLVLHDSGRLYVSVQNLR